MLSNASRAIHCVIRPTTTLRTTAYWHIVKEYDQKVEHMEIEQKEVEHIELEQIRIEKIEINIEQIEIER